ncbi:hypothetical protein pb186bvf_000613 [Paramecium bursaria]
MNIEQIQLFKINIYYLKYCKIKFQIGFSIFINNLIDIRSYNVQIPDFNQFNIFIEHKKNNHIVRQIDEKFQT